MPAPSAGARRQAARHYGKYRATVLDNIDPERMGRVMLEVPDVLGRRPSNWAMPCVPAAGVQSGFFIAPAIGAQVWAEFEGGDPDLPIWTGGFWGTAAEVPISASTQPMIIVLETTAQASLTVSDAPPTAASGGIILKSPGGAMIVVNDAGIFISNGKGATITLVGPTVDINAGALTIE
jgi:uncharacterized protein involved in type VI secretion and phage assembly